MANELTAYKTKGGEKYEKCGIKFGPEPTALDAETLATERGELGLTIGERLDRDARLVKCEVPKDAKPAKPKPPSPPSKDDGGKAAADKGGKATK